jgi:hypothetical protein
MIEFTDNISKIMSNDSQNGYSILTYCDISNEYTDNRFQEIVANIITNFPVLKQRIVKKDSDIILETIEPFDLQDYYKVIYDKHDNFDSYIDTLLNSQFETESRWLIRYIADIENKKYRIYFKIDHAYADGYKIIEMLMTVLKKIDKDTIFKPRNTNIMDTLYYYIIGTCILVYMNIKLFINILIKKDIGPATGKTSYIRCNPFKLSKIKDITKKHNITVNDFLYSLMIKTDLLYTMRKREIITCSSINISRLNNFNNMMPILNKITNSMEDTDLLNDVHTTFNYFKYSLYIPFTSIIVNNILNIVPLNTVNNLYNNLIQKIDYAYSNIIGPTHKALEDIHFLTLAKDKEIVFNIISSNDNINIICSFKEGVINDTKRFEQCIYEAYESLINT